MYKHFQLDNGIKIILENIPHFRSVSFGIWFRAGSAFENQKENGLSHFIEHMLFKGTKERTARQIAETIDSIGGQLNAFTAKEYTCFYCKVMDEHIETGINLLSDMILNSTIDEEEFEKEKSVILEEINMYEDSPEDLVHELLSEAFFGQHPLAMPILGRAGQLIKYSKSEMQDFLSRFYTTDNMVISAAGNIQEENLLKIIEKYFGNWNHRGSIPEQEKIKYSKGSILFTKKEIEQFHASIAFPGIPVGHDDIYPMLVMNNILGGGMSSRLFQKIREDRGLAYSVFSYPSSYLTGGMFSIYAGMKPNQTEEVLKLIMEEVSLLSNKGFNEREFNMAKEQLKGNYILSTESTGSRMNAIGKAKLLMDKVSTQEEIIEKINRVEPEDVKKLIQEILRPELASVALVGSEDMTERVWSIVAGGI
ncbi:MAG TPA: insulinase family protein [Clostridiales bacterium]|nr:insulinase family protein [Clostridiales bacterium]